MHEHMLINYSLIAHLSASEAKHSFFTKHMIRVTHSNRSSKQSSNQAIKQAIKQSSNQAINQASK